MDFEEGMYVFESPLLKYLILTQSRRLWVDDFYLTRNEDGEFSRSFDDLRKDEIKFYEYTRVQISTFDYILHGIGDQLQKYSNFRDCISPKEKLFLSLRYLSIGASFRSLAFSFRMSHTTIRRVIYETCNAIWEHFYERHMPFPTQEMFLSIENDFHQKWKFPNCIGALDGKHIRIKSPANSGSDFFNYKKYFSVVLQGLVDANYKFISVDVGSYGKQSDGGVLRTTNLYHHLEQGTFNVPPPKALPGTNEVIPHVIVADAAYPLKTYLMRPFSGENLSLEQDKFNQSLSRARRIVECTFGIITGKWRILKTEIEVHPDKVDLIVKTICLLQNISIDIEGSPDFSAGIIHENHTEKITGQRCFNRSTDAAYNIRNKFLQYFNTSS